MGNRTFYCDGGKALYAITQTVGLCLMQRNCRAPSNKLPVVFFLLRRCSIIEPGPVSTPMAVDVFQTGVDLTTADQKSCLIRDRVYARWSEFWKRPEAVVSPQQVAEVVREAILSENPHFRYQTNKHYCPDEIAAKLADINGNASVDIVTKRFCAE